MTRWLRRYVPELWFLGLVICWGLLTGASDGEPTGVRDVAGIGVAFAGAGVLLRAIAPLLLRGKEHPADRDDVRWQEQTSAAIQSLATGIAALAEEQRRHNQYVERLFLQRNMGGLGLE